MDCSEVFRQHSLLLVLFYLLPGKDNMIDRTLTGGKTVFVYIIKSDYLQDFIDMFSLFSGNRDVFQFHYFCCTACIRIKRFILTMSPCHRSCREQVGPWTFAGRDFVINIFKRNE